MRIQGNNGNRRDDRWNEEGMALVLALLVLLVLTVIGAALMANVNTETKISGYKVRDTQSLTVAEAGIQEAILRLRNGDVNDDLNINNVHVIFNQIAGSLPPVGADTTALPTLQPAGSYLPYTTATKGSQMLTIRYKTKLGVIQRYDDTITPKINGATGNPIWVIQSTGRQGTSSRTIYTEVTRSRFNIFARGAVAGDVAINFGGNIKICGHDHRMDTPTGAGPSGAGPLFCDGWLVASAHGSCLPAAWSSDSVYVEGSSTIDGDAPTQRSYQTGFYSGPWDYMGMTQAEFWPWVGTRVQNPPSDPHGIFYLDNNNVKQDHSGNYHYNGGDGEGLLYIDGNLKTNGSFVYRGLIYVEGDLEINGDAWILGGLVVKGDSQVKIANGSAIVLYSAEAVQQKISKYGGDLRTIAWREVMSN